MNTAQSYLQSLIAGAARSCSVEAPLAGSKSWPAWRKETCAALKDALGVTDYAGPLDFTVLEEKRCEGYLRRKVSYLSEPGLPTPAYLLLPEGADTSCPGVVAAHGHGYGVKAIVGLDPMGRERTGPADYQKDFAIALARAGFVVLAPELMGFGEMRLPEDEAGEGSSCHRLSTALLMRGRTMAGVRVGQAMRALDALSASGLCDAQRLGMMGISGGGLVACYTAALDGRVAACVISGFANTYASSILAVHHCVDNYQPGLMDLVEEADVLSLIAPRPMLWESGDADPIFPMQGVDEAEGVVRRVYGALGGGPFEVDRFAGDHQISGRLAYDFLRRNL